MFSRSHSEENLCIKYESLSSPERHSTAGSPISSARPKEENKDGVSGMDGKRYALRWRHHQSTVVAEVGSLYRDAALVDVTLACEDQRTYQAHKLVLSACSQYFQSLFSRHPAHQHPIIFLKDVSGDECEALLTYMYRGEVSVNQDQIPRILRVASSLQVRGLAEVETQSSRPSSPSYGDRGGHCGSSSPSPSTGPPTKCATPISEPQSPNGHRPVTPTPGQSLGHVPTDSGSSTRHPPVPPHPSSSLPPDYPSYHMMPRQRPHYDPSSLLSSLADPDRNRMEEKPPPPPQPLIGPYPPQLRVKPDLGGSGDVGVLSPLSLTDTPRPYLQHAIFSSFLGPEQHVPTVSQGYGRMFPISDPLRRVDRLCSAGGETRVHKCNYCSRKFKRKDHLKTHTRIHTGERPYKCKVCGRGFIQSQQVKIHMKVHIREDSSGSLGGSSMLCSGGPSDTRSALAALYPDLGSHYDHHANDKGARQHSYSNLDDEASPPQGSSHPDSDTEFSSEAPERGEFDAPTKDPPPRLIHSATGAASSLFSPTSSSTNNAPLSPMETNHSGGRGSPQPLEASPPDEGCGLSALKGSPVPYHMTTNLKK